MTRANYLGKKLHMVDQGLVSRGVEKTEKSTLTGMRRIFSTIGDGKTTQLGLPKTGKNKKRGYKILGNGRKV